MQRKMRISAMAASFTSVLLVVVLTVFMSSSLAASARADSVLLLPGSEKQDEMPMQIAKHNLVRAIFAFGDSGLDAGTNSLFPSLIRADFKPYGQNFSEGPTGRFTNGRNYADFFASYTNVSYMEPYLAKKGNSTLGVNYASAGSGVYLTTNRKNHVITFSDQISQFQETKLSIEDLLKNNANTWLGPKSLYIISIGEYDMLDYLLSDSWDPLENFVQGLVANIIKQIENLWGRGAGADKFLIIGMRNLGCLPAVLAIKNTNGSCVESFNNAAKRFNEVMEIVVKQIPSWFSSSRVIFGNPYNVFSQFTAPGNPFGFKSGSTACCGYGAYHAEVQCGRPAEIIKNPSTFLCDNADEYVYWDSYNPTEKAYELAAELFWKGNTTYVTPYNLETLASICIDKSQDCKW